MRPLVWTDSRRSDNGAALARRGTGRSMSRPPGQSKTGWRRVTPNQHREVGNGQHRRTQGYRSTVSIQGFHSGCANRATRIFTRLLAGREVINNETKAIRKAHQSSQRKKGWLGSPGMPAATDRATRASPGSWRQRTQQAGQRMDGCRTRQNRLASAMQVRQVPLSKSMDSRPQRGIWEQVASGEQAVAGIVNSHRRLHRRAGEAAHPSLGRRRRRLPGRSACWLACA